MSNIGEIIKKERLARGLSQEDLSAVTFVSVRTIQRIENGESSPKQKTLQLILDYLELKGFEDQVGTKLNWKKHWLSLVFFTVIGNFLLMAFLGFLTIDSFANFNSQASSLIFAVLLGILVRQNTSHISDMMRMLIFGSGVIIYAFIVLVKVGVAGGMVTMLFPSIVLYLFVLNFDMKLFQRRRVEVVRKNLNY